MSARAETAQRLGEKLRRELGEQILAWLAEPDIIEIMLNSDGALWLERLGRRPERGGEIHVDGFAAGTYQLRSAETSDA